MAVFSKMVGAHLIPDAKLYSLCFVIPLILVYSRLVDWMRRHHLLYCFLIFHGLGGLLFYFLLSHPVYGIYNTHTSPNRLVGWFFYFFMESFDAFFATTFWSFADSINNPKDAKNYYGFLVAGSKIGGILSAGCLYFFLQAATTIQQITLLPNALLAGSFFLLVAGGIIFCLVLNVSDNYMHGYEMAYQYEKHKKQETKTFWESFKSSFDGLFIIIKNPYVLGIFSLVIFCEIFVVIFDYWMVLYADKSHHSIGAMTAFYASYYFMMNLIGLGISLFGTTPILRFLGLRSSLFVFPILCIGLFVTTFLSPTTAVFYWIVVALRAFNYALNHPTREVLYIPTTKAIKYKAKAWTDAFGSRIAKSMGSLFNVSLKGVPQAFALLSSLSLCLGLASFWIVIAYFLGRTLQDAIEHQKVIGEAPLDQQQPPPLQ
jgi:AAA family ATP:ADP antiporter